MLELGLGPGPAECRRRRRSCAKEKGKSIYLGHGPTKTNRIRLTGVMRLSVEDEPRLRRLLQRPRPDKPMQPQPRVPDRVAKPLRAERPPLPILNGIGMTWILAHLIPNKKKIKNSIRIPFFRHNFLKTTNKSAQILRSLFVDQSHLKWWTELHCELEALVIDRKMVAKKVEREKQVSHSIIDEWIAWTCNKFPRQKDKVVKRIRAKTSSNYS